MEIKDYPRHRMTYNVQDNIPALSAMELYRKIICQCNAALYSFGATLHTTDGMVNYSTTEPMSSEMCAEEAFIPLREFRSRLNEQIDHTDDISLIVSGDENVNSDAGLIIRSSKVTIPLLETDMKKNIINFRAYRSYRESGIQRITAQLFGNERAIELMRNDDYMKVTLWSSSKRDLEKMRYRTGFII